MGPGESHVLAEKLLDLPALAAQHAGLKVVREFKKQSMKSAAAGGGGVGARFDAVPAEFLAHLKDKLSGSGDLLVKQLVGLKVRRIEDGETNDSNEGIVNDLGEFDNMKVYLCRVNYFSMHSEAGVLLCRALFEHFLLLFRAYFSFFFFFILFTLPLFFLPLLRW